MQKKSNSIYLDFFFPKLLYQIKIKLLKNKKLLKNTHFSSRKNPKNLQKKFELQKNLKKTLKKTFKKIKILKKHQISRKK